MTKDRDALISKIQLLEKENEKLKKSLDHFSENRSTAQADKTEEEYRLLVEQSTDLIVKFTPDGKLFYVSPSYCKLLKKKATELIGKNILLSVHKEDQEKTRMGIESLIKTSKTCYVEHRVLSPDNTYWLAWSNKAVKNEKGEITEIIGLGRDITSRKEAQASLHRHIKEMDVLNRFLRRLTSSLTIDDVMKSSINTLSKSLNQTLVAFYLKDENGLSCKKNNIRQFNLDEKLLNDPVITEKIEKSLKKQGPLFYERQKDGFFKIAKFYHLAIVPCSGNAHIKCCIVFCIFDPDYSFSEQHTFLETLCNEISVSMQNAYLYEEIKIHSNELSKANKDLLQEIKDRENIEAALKESEQNYREIFNATSEAIFVHDAESGMVTDVNDRVLEMYKCKRDEIIGMHPENFGANEGPFSSENAISLIKKASSEGPQLFEWLAQNMDGEQFWTEIALQSSIIGGKKRVLAVVRDISERKNAERAILNSEEKYKSLFENAADGIVLCDDNEIILDVNESFCSLISKNKDQILCKPLSSLFPKKEIFDINEIRNNIFEKNLITSKNRMIPVEIHIKKLGSNRFQAFFRDVTERTIAEQKLIETNNLLQAINNASPDAIFILNVISWKFSFFNRRFTELFQYSQNEISNAENIIQMLIFKEDENIAKIHFERLFKARDNVKIESEVRLQRKDGKIIWALVREQVFSRDSKGNVIETVGAINDISERKKAEEEILLTNSFLQAIFNTSPDVIIVSDFDTRNIFYISRKIENVSLYSLEHCINSRNIIEELLYENDRELYLTQIEKIESLKEDETLEFEFRIVRNDSSVIWVRYAAIIFKRDDQGKILQTLGILREITERKMAHQKLIESESKFRNIFNTSTDGIAILDENKKIIEANQSLIKLTGLKKEILFSTVFPTLIENTMTKQITSSIENCHKRKSGNVIECNLIHSNSNLIPSEVEFKSIDYEGSIAVLALVHDISERKEAEKKIFDAIIVTEEKERETFAKNLHDDLGPLLSSIRMYLNSFQDTRDVGKQEYIIQQVNGILKQAIQCTKEVSNDLSPHILTNYGLVSAIESFIANFIDLINIEFSTNVINHRFENTIEMTVFRISKELINNTIKHANASNVSIVLNYANDKLIIWYADDGKGFNFEDNSDNSVGGMGVFNIKNRVKTLNGTIDFEKLPKGINLNIEIPAKVKKMD